MANLPDIFTQASARAAIRIQQDLAARVFNAPPALPEPGGGLGLAHHLGGLELWEDSRMGPPGASHWGTVKEFRKSFKKYSKSEFREISNKPVIKDILSGMTKLNKEEIKERIAEHLAEAQ